MLGIAKPRIIEAQRIGALPSLPVRFATVTLETVAFLRARLTVALARVTTTPKPEKIRFCQTLAAILAH